MVLQSYDNDHIKLKILYSPERISVITRNDLMAKASELHLIIMARLHSFNISSAFLSVICHPISMKL